VVLHRSQPPPQPGHHSNTHPLNKPHFPVGLVSYQVSLRNTAILEPAADTMATAERAQLVGRNKTTDRAVSATSRRKNTLHQRRGSSIRAR